jgi:putative zinc finger/helix-turn-helix YgiT family protein
MKRLTQRKEFPWRCSRCRAKEVQPAVIGYTARVNHDGRIYELGLPALNTPRCRACGEVILDDQADEQISAALREHLGLLTPEQIRRALRALGMQQKTLAACLGIAEATLSRWLSGGLIQSRAMDNLMRVCFGIPAVRTVLTGTPMKSDFGVPVTGT